MSLFLVIYALLFLTVLSAYGLGRAFIVSQEKTRLRAMLRQASTSPNKRQKELVNEFDQSPWQLYLHHANWLEPVRRLIRQANLKLPVESFLFFTFGGFTIALIVAEFVPMLSRYRFAPAIPACVVALLPFLVVRHARKRRMAQFEEQFAGALDFLARSLRAGHAFTIGLEMLVADAQEPLAGCFRRVMQTLQLGSPLEVALAELSDSIPSVDVRFFVSAVLLQQGTGGNLGEILDTMANVIRARFKLKGAVKAASAHGRITGLVLSLMPICLGVLMLFLAPAYIFTLIADPLGQKMLVCAGADQIVGYFFINKITQIEA